MISKSLDLDVYEKKEKKNRSQKENYDAIYHEAFGVSFAESC